MYSPSIHKTIRCLLVIYIIGYFTVSTEALMHSFVRNTANNGWERWGRTMSNLEEARAGRLLVTELDEFRNLFVLLRRAAWGATDLNNVSKNNRDHGKMQRHIPRTEPFPCNVTYGRSPEAPSSINRLRPGDIDVVASLGDSLSAGNGIISETITHILNEVRGITFSGGGFGTWRQYLTLPNILKVFNPQLYGYSTDNGLTVDRSSHLNIAEPMIMSRDLPFQVRTLIDRMRFDPHIDMQRHWKLLTIFVGNNDICSDMCHYNDINVFLQRHENDLRHALTILRDNVPRLLVNILPVPNIVTTLQTMRQKPLICTIVHLVGCHCIFSERIVGAELRKLSEYIGRWQHVDEQVSALPEFQTNDFGVIYHPFITNITVPSVPNGNIDLRYFASDCFHFSQLGQASLANALWNSMMQPIAHRQNTIQRAFRHFECPTEAQPYIATLQNSREARRLKAEGSKH